VGGRQRAADCHLFGPLKENLGDRRSTTHSSLDTFLNILSEQNIYFCQKQEMMTAASSGIWNWSRQGTPGPDEGLGQYWGPGEAVHRSQPPSASSDMGTLASASQ